MNPFCLEHIVVLVVSLDSTLGIQPKSDHPSNVVCFCVIKISKVETYYALITKIIYFLTTLTIFPSAVLTNSVVVGNDDGSDLLFKGETKTQLSAKSNSIHRHILTRCRQANFIKIILI